MFAERVIFREEAEQAKILEALGKVIEMGIENKQLTIAVEDDMNFNMEHYMAGNTGG